MPAHLICEVPTYWWQLQRMLSNPWSTSRSFAPLCQNADNSHQTLGRLILNNGHFSTPRPSRDVDQVHLGDSGSLLTLWHADLAANHGRGPIQHIQLFYKMNMQQDVYRLTNFAAPFILEDLFVQNSVVSSTSKREWSEINSTAFPARLDLKSPTSEPSPLSLVCILLSTTTIQILII